VIHVEPEPRWATVAEAYAHLRGAVSERTLRRWIAQGRLTGHRLGPRKIQIDLNELDALRGPIRPVPTTTTSTSRERTPDARQAKAS
jgi:excisionase family DNA binding protein